VNPAALAVTASAESKSYGQTVTFGSGSTLFTSSGLQNGETIGSVTLAVSNNGGAATAPVGTYTITPSAATGGTFNPSNYTITYNTGTLTVTMATNGYVIALDSSAAGALTVSGSASINVSGFVYVDSSSPSALTASGAASIRASAIDVHGGVAKSGSPTFNPTPTTGAAVLADPLAGVALPSTSGMTNYGSEVLGGNSSATIQPGIYSQIRNREKII
jgi:hypothetical protein